jgi:carbon monoxide dehydrogenase subunit G
MIIEGTHTLQAPPDEVWQVLMDPDTLKRAMPGIEYIEPIDNDTNDTYKVALSLQQSPFKGHHQGRLTFTQQRYPRQYHLTIEGEERNTFQVACTVHLHEREQKTIVTYRGTLVTDLADTIRTQKLIKGAVKHLLQQYFLGLTDTLYARNHEQLARNNHRGTDPVVLQQARGNIAILPQSQAEKRAQEQGTTWWNVLTDRVASLIWKDPLQRATWGKRIRKTSTIVSLLLLVWAGTKIPRRHR